MPNVNLAFCRHTALKAHGVWLGWQATAAVQEKEAELETANADFGAKVCSSCSSFPVC